MLNQLFVALGVMALASIFFGKSAVHAEAPKANKAVRTHRVDAIRPVIQDKLAHLVELYKHLHAHPELSYQEEQTAARLAKEMKQLGFEVTSKVGGHGLVCIYKNGAGPTILVRTDMDALPVTEKTGVPYASKARARDKHGNDVGVMHACGHDMHMTCWLGTAHTLLALKDHWQGTLLFLAQPAEEVGAGARMMLDDGLYKRFPKPDFALALHCDSRLQAEHLHFTEGLAMANVDTVDIIVKGKGGHGAAPHTTIDPVVIAARMILDFQTIVSREMNPTDPAVVTVGSIHGGTKHNIVPNEVKLQLTVRTTRDDTRKHVLDAIKRIAKAAADASRAPEPEITIDLGEFTPALINDRKLTRQMVGLFEEILGKDKIHERPPMMGGEDFSRYSRDGVPVFMYFLGTIDADRWAESVKPGGKPLPSMHSDSFWPTIDPSIRNGVLTMSMAVLEILGKEKQ